MQNAECRMQNYRFRVIPRRASPDVGISRVFRRLPHQSADWFAMTFGFYSPMDCMTLFRAVFMGSLSGSLEEGVPSQSHS